MTMIEKLMDIEPQLTVVEHGTEPSLREILAQYYTDHGIEDKEARKLVSRYIQALVDASQMYQQEK